MSEQTTSFVGFTGASFLYAHDVNPSLTVTDGANLARATHYPTAADVPPWGATTVVVRHEMVLAVLEWFHGSHGSLAAPVRESRQERDEMEDACVRLQWDDTTARYVMAWPTMCEYLAACCAMRLSDGYNNWAAPDEEWAEWAAIEVTP